MNDAPASGRPLALYVQLIRLGPQRHLPKRRMTQNTTIARELGMPQTVQAGGAWRMSGFSSRTSKAARRNSVRKCRSRTAKSSSSGSKYLLHVACCTIACSNYLLHVACCSGSKYLLHVACCMLHDRMLQCVACGSLACTLPVVMRGLAYVVALLCLLYCMLSVVL